MNNYDDYGTSPRKYYPEYDNYYTKSSKMSAEERRQRIENRKKNKEKLAAGNKEVKKTRTTKNQGPKKPTTKFNLKQQELKRQREIERKIQLKNNLRFGLSIGLVIFMAFFLVYKKSVADQKFLEVSKLKNSITEIEKENAQLQYNLQTTASLLNVETEAISKLGMTKLDNKRIVKLTVPKQDYVEKIEQEISKESNNSILDKIYGLIMEII